MKLFHIDEYDLEGNIDKVIERLRKAKRDAKAMLKVKGKKLSEWEIIIETDIEYGYYDEANVSHEVYAMKKK